MKELTEQETMQVSGGLAGTQIPFTSSFISGANWPAGGSGAIMGATVAWGIGVEIGNTINNFNTYVTGMSLGEAIYRTEQMISNK